MIVYNINELKHMVDGLPYVSSDDIKIIYIIGNFDGFWDGVIEWEKKNYYFVCYNDDLDHPNMSIREYALLDLTEDQRQDLQQFSDLFAQQFSKSEVSVQDGGHATWSNRDDFYSEYLRKSNKYTISKDQVVARWSVAHE